MSTRSGESTPKAEEKRGRILAAALELFAERGYEATTMRDIARRAGVATGAAYYYFPSKESLVMEFYRETQSESLRVSHLPLEGTRDLKERLRAVIGQKLEQFEPHRATLAALFRTAVDPTNPISPFGDETREIREGAVEILREALLGSDAKLPKDLKEHLPRLLWYYQMGIILFWLHDRSEGATRTHRLVDGSLNLIVRLIRMSRLPVLAAARREMVALLDSVESS